MREPILVSTTLENQDDAEALASNLLRNRLVACAQIHGPVKSMYWWKEDLAESVEFILTVKTFGEVYDQVEKLLLDEHPYDVPEIIAEPLVRVSPEYLSWMVAEIDQ